MTLLQAQRSTPKRLYLALTAVFIGTGLLQLMVSWNQPHPTYYMHTDSVVYWGNAISLWDQGVFEYVTQAPGGTSLILAGFVAGGLGPWETLLIGYSLSHALSAVFAGLLVLRLGARPSAAVLTAALIGCYPPLLNYSRQILSGPWFVAANLAGLYLGLSSRRSVAIAGWTVFSFAVFVRTPGLAALLLILVALVFSRELRPLLPAAVAGATLTLALGVIAHLTVRFPFISTTDILAWSRPGWGGYYFQSDPGYSYLGLLVDSPGQFLLDRVKAFVCLMTPWPMDPNRSVGTRLAILSSDLPIYTLVLLGLRSWWKGDRPQRPLLPLLAAMGLIAFYTLTVAENRYRLPISILLLCSAVPLLSSQWEAIEDVASRGLTRLRGQPIPVPVPEKN